MRPALPVVLLSILAIAASSGSAQDGTFVKSSTGCPPFGNVLSPAPYTILSKDAWNLDGRSYTFTLAGTDWFVLETGAWIPPTAGAQVIGPSDDTVLPNQPLGFIFPFVGGTGSTTIVDVAPNGYIYFESGTNTATRCCNAAAGLGNFLAATPSVAVLGTDLDSSTAGQILFETITVGMNTVAVFTWEDVPEWPRNGLNTVQGQLWDNGDVVISHLRTSGQRTLDTALVGISAGGGVTDPGPINLNPSIGLQIDTFPNLDTTVTINTDNIPLGASFAELEFGAGQVSLPLVSIGAPPGCSLLVSPIFIGAPMVVTPPTASLTFPISSDPGTIGISFELQALVADLTQLGAFSIPVFVSDRATMTVGQLSNNDDCIGAIPITDGVIVGDTLTATTSAVTGSCANMGAEVWYEYFATCTGTATFSFCSGGGSASYDTAIAVFSGPCGSLVELGCNDDFCGQQSELAIPVTVGTSYFVAVGGFVGATTGPRQGTFAMSVTCQ